MLREDGKASENMENYAKPNNAIYNAPKKYFLKPKLLYICGMEIIILIKHPIVSNIMKNSYATYVRNDEDIL